MASDELDAARWRSRAAVRLHLFMCKECRRYKAQMRALGNAARKAFQGSDDTEVLARLKDRIRRQGKD